MVERNDENMAIETTTSVDVKTLTPFKRFIMTIGILPTSYLESMTYAELVMWFCNFLQNEVIPTVNNNAQAVKEIQDFINTLDLQDEVNNKLDEMAESGELQEIIAEYLNANALWCFDNVASLKIATNLIDGSFAKTLGYRTKNDGGSATYKIRKITNEDVIDEMTILSLDDENLIAELIINDIICIDALGAYGDGTHDDSSYISKAVSLGKTILFGNKNYLCNSQINITTCCKLLGTSATRESGRFYIDFSNNSDNDCFVLQTKGIIFENLNFKGDRTKHIGFTISNNSRYTFRNCGFYYFNKAIYTNRAWSTSFYDCVFEYCENCVELNGINTSILFNGTIFYSSTNGIVSNQELDYSNIVGGGFDHVDQCIYLSNDSYANNITVLNCGFEDYITGIRCTGNSQANVISCTFVNTERSVDTYRGSGKIVVISGRSDTALTPNKNDVIYITPVLPINANISNGLVAHNQKIGSKTNKVTHYDFDYSVSNGTILKINYNDTCNYNIRMDVTSTQYPESCNFTKYSTTVTKTQSTFNTFTTSNDTTNKIYNITFNQGAVVHITGFITNDGYVS